MSSQDVGVGGFGALGSNGGGGAGGISGHGGDDRGIGIGTGDVKVDGLGREASTTETSEAGKAGKDIESAWRGWSCKRVVNRGEEQACPHCHATVQLHTAV